MNEVVPAILPKNYEDLKNKISLVRGVVPIVQVDLCDGVFVPSLTWPFHSPSDTDGVKNAELDSHFVNILTEREGMPFWEDVDFELDLMVHDAVENFDIYTKLGPKRILFHLEAVGDIDEFKQFLEGIDNYVRDSIQIGVALNPSTPLEQLYKIANDIDCVQIMGNDKIGYQGVELDPIVYEKVKTVREKYFDMPISVDIGVNMDTAPLLLDAGVTRIVAGSAIFNTDDIIGRIEYFRNL
jgi:ribulose-phosphate 3-epimerase